MRRVLFVLLALIPMGMFCTVEAPAHQKSDTRKMMAEKLKMSQQILEGMVTSDFDKISAGAKRLIEISRSAEWFMRKTPRYELHSDEFRRSAETILKKAKEKNLDGVALGYVDMTLTCVRCHQYVRDVTEARRPEVPESRQGVALLVGRR
jgi:hypothetical protein